MTSSDLLLESEHAHELIDKSNLSIDKKNKLHLCFDIQHSILDDMWTQMIKYNNIYEQFNTKGNDYEAFAKLFKMISRNMAKSFQEKDYFGYDKSKEASE